MTPLSGREFARLVEHYGWNLLLVHGSHHIYGKPGSIVRLSIPVHGNKRHVHLGTLRRTLALLS